MIHAHIKRVATSVDEESFRVQLPDRYAHSNEEFEDGDGLDPDWLKDVWKTLFEAKLDAAGIVIPQGAKVLDACCGQGFLGEFLSSKGGVVTFCDLSPLQLKSLRARFSERSSPPRIVKADLLRLPFDDGEFDVVVGNSFLHHLPDVHRGLAELARVLKTGGRLILFHEPSNCANFWESFPVSLFRDTACNSGFTDLWQFEVDKLSSLIARSGFEVPEIVGSGLLSALLLNPYLITMSKLGVTHRWALEPAFRLRSLFHRLETPLRRCLRADSFPSLFIAARCLGGRDMK